MCLRYWYLCVTALLVYMRNRVTRNIDMNKHREMNKKTYVFTVDVSCLISLKYFTLYAVSVKETLTLLISSLLKAVAAQEHKVVAVTRLVWVRSPLGGLNYNFIIFSFRLIIFSVRTSVTHYTQYLIHKVTLLKAG